MINKNSIAKTIRVITSPPIMVLILLTALFCLRNDLINSLSVFVMSIIFLTIVPLLAYPIAWVIPKLKAKGREGERNTAFVFNLIGFISAFLYGIIADVSKEIMIIFLNYLLSVIILIVFNKIIKLRASGHASAISGPLILSVYFIGFKLVVPCILIYIGVVWSSLTLKRHTIRELFMGTVVTVVAFVLSIFVSPLF